MKGPNIEQMAQQYGLSKVYEIGYRFGSLETHGTMPGIPLMEDEEIGMVSQLPATISILRAILVEVNNRLDGRDTTAEQILRILNLRIGGK
jgi:hypothetical protein